MIYCMQKITFTWRIIKPNLVFSKLTRSIFIVITILKFQRGSERLDWLGPWLPKGTYCVQNSQIIKNYKWFKYYGKTYLGIYIFAGSSSHFSRFYLEEKRISKSTLITAKAENFLHVRKYKLYANQSHMNSLGGCMPLFFKFIFLFIHTVFIRHYIRSISPVVVEAFFRDIFIAVAQNKGTSKGLPSWSQSNPESPISSLEH